MLIRSVAVLGAGTMGAQIAAHFANAGMPVLLLDVTADAAKQGLQRARALKPDPLFVPDAAKLITTDSFEAGLTRIAESDWIIEAVVERLDIKRALLEKVDAARRAGSIVSSNTSGIPIAALSEGRSDDFRKHWLGTHFFNPPRYLHLLEIIPTPATDDAIVRAVAHFADHRLGKGVVVAKDSPGFIGNHIAMYGLLGILTKVEAGEYTIEEVDAITGAPLGRPRSATFRTLDIAGLDIVGRVVDDLRERLPDPSMKDTWTLPPFVTRMLERGMTGEKAGQGFYKRVKNAQGESEILTIDPATLEYRPQQRPKLPALDSAGSITDTRERVKTLFEGTDKVGQFLRDTLAPSLAYTAKVTSQIAHSADDVDRVMRWGFGWELGPFELIDAIGLKGVTGRTGPLPPAAPGLQILKSAKDRSRVVKKNAGASLVDLGDGVLCVEFHSKMNAIGGDTIQMLQAGVREASKNFAALVIGNEGQHFSAGANLILVLLEAQDENWDEIELMIRAFQQATMALRYSDVPVVVAPGGLTLGGACEISLHGDRVQAAAETYMGLVEAGVGLIPAGGGTKEMVARAAEEMAPGTGVSLPPIQRVFETIAFARVSTSAVDAERLGYLRPIDAFTMNSERLLSDAKARALQRVEEGYHPPAPRTAIPVGGETVLAPLKLGIHLAWRAGRISDHDVVIARTLATIMAGGTLPHASVVTEQHLLDLEREAFLKLLGERKTQDRIQYHVEDGQATEKLMKIIDRGGGTAIVVIPGVQGRWEWMRPAIDTLAQRCRMITFSLADEPTCKGTFDERNGFGSYVDQVADALDKAGIQKAAICGVSYGGLIAGAFAARFPDRVSSLVLVSAIPPSWTPDRRVRFYLRAPWLLSPLFCIGALRMYGEIAAANPGLAAGVRAALRHAVRVLTHPFSPGRMARRVRLLDGAGLQREISRINVPTLIVTGDPALDRVVPVRLTHEYLRMWPHAHVTSIAHTGHLGLITRPDEFARIVVHFAENAARHADTSRRRIG